MENDVTYSVRVLVGNHTEEYPLRATNAVDARRERDLDYHDAELWFFRRSDSCHTCLD